MAQKRGDTSTLDLLSWTAPSIVARYDEDKVRAASLRARIAKAVAQTLGGHDESRTVVAKKMSAWLDEEVTKHMLDAYASESRENHTITFLRTLALVEVTGDVRLLQLGAEFFDRSVVEDRYLEFVDLARLKEHQAEVESLISVKERAVRRGGNP